MKTAARGKNPVLISLHTALTLLTNGSLIFIAVGKYWVVLLYVGVVDLLHLELANCSLISQSARYVLQKKTINLTYRFSRV